MHRTQKIKRTTTCTHRSRSTKVFHIVPNGRGPTCDLGGFGSGWFFLQKRNWSLCEKTEVCVRNYAAISSSAPTIFSAGFDLPVYIGGGPLQAEPVSHNTQMMWCSAFLLVLMWPFQRESVSVFKRYWDCASRKTFVITCCHFSCLRPSTVWPQVKTKQWKSDFFFTVLMILLDKVEIIA